MDDLTLARWRLRTQRLAGEPYPDLAAVVGGLLGVQAENYSQASWAIATRTTGLTVDEFDRRFDAGEILRTHVLRPTWHFVLPEDIRWLLDVTRPRIQRSRRAVQRELGLDDETITASVQAIVDILGDGRHRTRNEIGTQLEARGLPDGGQALGLALAFAEQEALICSGVRSHGAQTYALLAERAPDTAPLDREDALGRLAFGYFDGHGPATERDLAYWASLTLTDVRRGIAAVHDRLESLEHDGRTYWFTGEPPETDELSPRGHLLQILDEYYRGYQDSRRLLDVAGLMPGGRETSIGMVLLESQIVGSMRRSVSTDSVRFEIMPFRELDAGEIAALQSAAHRYGRFLGLEPVLSFGS